MTEFGDRDIVIVGAGGHAKVVADSIRKSREFRIVGYLSDHANDHSMTIDGVSVFGPIAQVPELKKRGLRNLHIAIGDNDRRNHYFGFAESIGVPLPAIKDPDSIVSDMAAIRTACFVGPGAIVNAGAVLENGVIVNSGAIIEHDCIIGRFSHIAPGACLTGKCSIGERVLFGAAAVARPNISIGDGAVIGAGSVVVCDIANLATVKGNPARA